MKLGVRTVSAPMRAPLVTGHGTVTDRELVLVSLEAADGWVGYGEAAPLQSYDGVSAAEVAAALEDCRPVLAAYRDAAPMADVLARCGEATVLSQALSAIDLALWDLAGRRTREPVWRLLGAGPPAAVAVNWTIAAVDRSGAAHEAAQARADGFSAVKVKVAIGDDAGRLAAVRAFAGPQMAIRIDANGAWSLGEARATLDALQPVGIELCEEPVAGLEAIRALSQVTRIPLALDESADDPQALVAPAAADLICLKVSRCGGITGTIQTAERARAAGYDVYLASTLDGPLGIAAALHAAAVIRPERACGLATLGLFADRADPMPPLRGALAPPATPGLGEELLSWYGR
ncbi:MAG TPA: enolase C-terminal domain-like protein [Solirubrobacteraceae bacterium]|nr:enolase C-terminal domain-like protein [Solirubrobacteraceae bacterium]